MAQCCTLHNLQLEPEKVSHLPLPAKEPAEALKSCLIQLQRICLAAAVHNHTLQVALASIRADEFVRLPSRCIWLQGGRALTRAHEEGARLLQVGLLLHPVHA